MLKELRSLQLPEEIFTMLENAPSVTFAKTIEELYEMALPPEKDQWASVGYDVPGKGYVEEATVCYVKNGIAANYPEPYMRRREPNCMRIGDDNPTDKPRFKDIHGRDFKDMRAETLDWLSTQPLAVFAFLSGQEAGNFDSLAIIPANAGFFAFGLGLLQGVIDPFSRDKEFKPRVMIFAAPPFRHTHFDGKQIVVHNRFNDRHEIFSYNLYPGPSAKKGIYAALLDIGEQEGWTVPHAAIVRLVTPYGNKIVVMHEGASGGGKSEMLEHVHRENDGSLLFAVNTMSEEEHYLTLPQTCTLYPGADDMVLASKNIQKNDGYLYGVDAERSWFIRVDHIKRYGTDPDIEARAIHPKTPLLFLNIDAQPGATALLWEHVEDAPGIPCPNPRFVLPRDTVPNIMKKPMPIHVRSFGFRAPACTRENPTYGIVGLFHPLPPALAWLWRLVAPRGHNNPSIVDTSGGMKSEGVGSYWPFATGRKVDQANLLLEQFTSAPKVQYVLCPNQNIGAWNVGFMSEWIMREYIARRGGVLFMPEHITAARCSLLGYSLKEFSIEGQDLNSGYLQVWRQTEVGVEGYDKGAKILEDFFLKEVKQFLCPDLDPLGKKIIECCLDKGTVEDYAHLLKGASYAVED